MNDLAKCLVESVQEDKHSNSKLFITPEKLGKWIDHIKPKMLASEDDTVMSIKLGSFEDKDGNEVGVSAMMQWQDGYDADEKDKFVDDKGYGLNIGLYETDSDYMMMDWKMLNDSTLMSDDTEAIVKWLVDDFNRLASGEKLLDECNDKKKQVTESYGDLDCADIQIDICTCNAAFEENKEEEVARLLRKAADTISNHGVRELYLTDANGNRCFHLKQISNECNLQEGKAFPKFYVNGLMKTTSGDKVIETTGTMSFVPMDGRLSMRSMIEKAKEIEAKRKEHEGDKNYLSSQLCGTALFRSTDDGHGDSVVIWSSCPVDKLDESAKAELTEASAGKFVVLFRGGKPGEVDAFGTFDSVEDAKKFIEDDRAKRTKKIADKIGKDFEEVNEWYKLETRKEDENYFTDFGSWEIKPCLIASAE